MDEVLPNDWGIIIRVLSPVRMAVPDVHSVVVLLSPVNDTLPRDVSASKKKILP